MSFIEPTPPARNPPPAPRAMAATKLHFEDLDFLRGIAAIMVMAFHFGERTDLAGLAPHGYLAVDLFFIMSGFVISHAYGPALDTGRLGLGRFIVLRLCRFLPMLALGTTLAAVIELGRPGGLNSLHLHETLRALITGCLLVPTFHAVSVEHVLFPLNGPAWSLFFELIGNVAFAVLVVCRLPRVFGVLLLLAAALWLGAYLVEHHTLDAAGALPADFAAGFPRVALGLGLGVVLHRLPRPSVGANRWLLAALVVGLTMVPRLPGPAETLYTCVVLLVLCPAIVVLATASRPQVETAILVRWSGLVSFPLYAIHYPIARAVGFAVLRAHPPEAIRLAAVLASCLGIVVLAVACEIFYDRPLRRRLRRLVLT